MICTQSMSILRSMNMKKGALCTFIFHPLAGLRGIFYGRVDWLMLLGCSLLIHRPNQFVVSPNFKNIGVDTRNAVRGLLA